MPQSKREPSPKATQRTPEGLEIPVPTRDEFERNMDKIVSPAKPEANGEPEQD